MSHRLSIVELTGSDEDSYEEFLRSFDQTLLYSSIKYRNLLRALLRCGVTYLLAKDNGRIAGALPLMSMDGDYGRIWNSLPYFGSNGGVISRTADAQRALAEEYRAIVSSGQAAASTVVSNPLLPISESLYPFDLTDLRIGQFTGLSAADDAERLLARFEKSTRWSIRKAAALGITISIDNSRIDFVERHHQEYMAEIGGRAKTPAFFAGVATHFKPAEDFDIYLAEKDGELISALLLFYYNRTVEYFTPVTLKAFRSLQPMPLIIYTAMQDAARRGFSRWNWGGTWLSQTGVYGFKKRWDTSEARYRYYTKLNNQDLLALECGEILKTYPDFFVVPFASLKTKAPND